MLMKKLLLTFAVLLGFALPGLAAETLVASMTRSLFSTQQTNYSNSSTSDNGDWYVDKVTVQSSDFRAGKKSTGTQTAEIQYKKPIDGKLSSIKINILAIPTNAGTLNSIAIYSSDNLNFTNATEIGKITSATEGENSITVTGSTTGNYYKVVFDITNSTSKNGTVQFSQLDFYIDEPTGPVDFEPAFKNQAYTIYKGETLDVNSLITVNTPPLSHLRAS